MIEEPCEGNLHARFCEGKRINRLIRRIGEAKLEDELYGLLIQLSTRLNEILSS